MGRNSRFAKSFRRPYALYGAGFNMFAAGLGLMLALALCLLSVQSFASEDFSIAAAAAVLIDGASGRILYGQNENEMLPEASCTKIMTALLALENSALDEDVTAGKNAHGVTGTSLYLSEGETLSMEQMLYGLMLRSGNDASVAIAEHIAGSVPDFAKMMNDRAKQLNADANFVNPHGLDADGHKASALGLARIMREALKNETFRTITGTQRKIIPWVGNEYSRVLENKNRLLSSYEGTTGGKTGYTSKAGRCLVFSAKREGMELIGVVLRCPNWFDEAERLLDYGFERYRLHIALEKGAEAAQASVLNGEKSSVSAIAEEQLAAAVEKDAKPSLSTELEQLSAPVEAAQQIGTAYLKLDGDTLAQTALVAADGVKKWSLPAAFVHIWESWLTLE